MRPNRDVAIMVVTVLILAGISSLAQTETLTIVLSQNAFMIAFHAVTFVLGLMALFYVFRMSRIHKKNISRSLFSPNFVYILLGCLAFVLYSAWFIFFFADQEFGLVNMSSGIAHVGGQFFLLAMLLLFVKGFQNIYRAYVVKI